MKKRKSCFVAAPMQVDTSVIRRVLRAQGWEIRDFTRAAATATPLAQQIKNEIAGSDLFIGVLSGTHPNPNVAYEAGLASGLGKPIIWVSDIPLLIPFDISEFPVVYASPRDEEPLTFALGQMLDRIGQAAARARRRVRGRPKPRPSVDRPTIVVKEAIADQIEELRAKGTGLKLERLLLKAFKADSGVSASVEKKTQDGDIDTAIWIDGYDAVLGNPVLVEVKIGILSDRRLLQAESQLAGYLFRSNAKFGLLAYLDRGGQRFPRRGGWPVIIRMDAVDLVRAMEKSPLGEVLRRERHQLFHARSLEVASDIR